MHICATCALEEKYLDSLIGKPMQSGNCDLGW